MIAPIEWSEERGPRLDPASAAAAGPFYADRWNRTSKILGFLSRGSAAEDQLAEAITDGLHADAILEDLRRFLQDMIYAGLMPTATAASINAWLIDHHLQPLDY